MGSVGRRVHSHSMRKKKVTMPMAAVMMPGTTKDRPHCPLTQMPAIKEPRMLPTDVWEFQIPMMKPRLEGRREDRRGKRGEQKIKQESREFTAIAPPNAENYLQPGLGSLGQLTGLPKGALVAPGG